MALCGGVAALLAIAGAPAAAAFDCAKAAQPIDFVICADADLQARNDAHARAWRAALETLGEAGRRNLVDAQKHWNAQVTVTCELPAHGRPSPAAIAKAKGCVDESLDARTTVLQQIALIGQGQYGGAGRTDRIWDVGPYTLILRPVRRDDDERDVLMVLREGTWLYSLDQRHLYVNPKGFFEDIADWEGSRVPFAVGQDVLGLGAPTLVVSGFSGAAHCCFDLTVLVLGPTFVAMPTIALRDDEDVKVVRTERRPAVITVTDFSFAYWRTSFADSFAPRVPLSYDTASARYQADPTLMADPLAPAEKRIAEAERIHEQHRRMLAAIETRRRAGAAVIADQVPGSMNAGILALIYGGHWREARAFLTDAWAGSAQARDDYWTELTACVLRRSPFWPAVAALNHVPAAPPACRPPP